MPRTSYTDRLTSVPQVRIDKNNEAAPKGLRRGLRYFQGTPMSADGGHVHGVQNPNECKKIARGNLTFDKFEQPWRCASSNEGLGI